MINKFQNNILIFKRIKQSIVKEINYDWEVDFNF